MNIQELKGIWKAGWALDLHTISSIPLGDGHFETTYTSIGKALNLLKYHNDFSQIIVLTNCTVEFLRTIDEIHFLNAIIPTPASVQREIQPVYEIARNVGKILNIFVDTNYLIKNKYTSPQKELVNNIERKSILKGSYDILDSRYAHRKVLLFDDLYRSGSTLNEITKTLYQKGKVHSVYVVTITKTRSLR